MKRNTEINLDSTDLLDKGAYLVGEGWIEKHVMLYVKNGIEIFFDNSNAIEIYNEGNKNVRLGDYYATTVKDLFELLKNIEEGRYK